ncbi:MAG: SAM-dependent methyltransferase [Opitutales bacterium]|jgi:23S rRNA (cytosine1962-C5)-methyltransferase|nr:SAM-dependent methyltransferase [Opitutales bacterium]MDG2253911.1 class I SAM-dependent methyltransferase [Opitutaceae bacterium]MBT5170343.1 SAM-dependent methyltransferase [Opitutales bacterium]MBT5815892.1 SAM-dependent methyltransferase [Opitutales bacterium]MBT6381472.1 SAM-dependent methyltransferase [Opitutales bacterium]
MILADKWRDYEILECGDGMKKERWGEFILVRPDPQVIWPLNSSSWGNYDAFYHRSDQGGGKWKYRTQLPESWKINYRNSVLKIKPTDFKHTGLFPEQAANWDWFSKLINKAKSPPKVLNLFGYTGGATIAAASAGASVCHVDAAKGMVAWCRENAALSNLSDAPIRYIVDDCMKFVEREIRRGTQYDGIIMDPPSYGRGKKGEVWQFDRDLWKFLQKCRQLLTPKPLFFLVNAYTTGVSPIVVGNLVRETLSKLDGTVNSGEIGIPISNSLNALPCGLFARWQRRLDIGDVVRP